MPCISGSYQEPMTPTQANKRTKCNCILSAHEAHYQEAQHPEHMTPYPRRQPGGPNLLFSVQHWFIAELIPRISQRMQVMRILVFPTIWQTIPLRIGRQHRRVKDSLAGAQHVSSARMSRATATAAAGDSSIDVTRSAGAPPSPSREAATKKGK